MLGSRSSSGKIWGFEVAVVVIGLLTIAQQSLQLISKHPLHEVIQRINTFGPYLGLVLEYKTNEQALIDSEVFVPSSKPSVIEVAGRNFHIGKIKGADVIYVKTGDASANAAATVQLLIDLFDIKGIVHYGTAGAVNDSLSVGDVVSPSHVAFTGTWFWKEFEAEKGQLRFGEYNYPVEGDNLLGSIDFQPSTLYTTGSEQTIFWLPINNSTWFETATKLQNVELEQCLSADNCLPRAPVLVHGLRASTADIFVQNAAYREFLYKKLKASTVDEETASVVLVALSNEVPVIVFRGVSNMSGGSTAYKNYSYLGSINALKVAVEFIVAISSSDTLHTSY